MIDVPAPIWWLVGACLAPLALLALCYAAFLVHLGFAMLLDWRLDQAAYRAAQVRHQELAARVRAKLDRKDDAS